MSNKTKQSDKPQAKTDDPAAAPELNFLMVSTDLIDDPAQPMRKDLSPASVEDLVLSIKQVGIIEPLVVKLLIGRYEVIAGHRRLFASKLAKLPEVPCYVRKATLEQNEMLKIHENLYRLDVKPADEASHFSYLIQKQKMTPTQIANLISKSLSYVTERLAILSYPDFLREALDKQEISFAVCQEFARFDDVKQMRTAVYYAMRGGMTQSMARKWVQDFKRSKETPALQANPVTNDATGQQEIEHTANCVYCRNKVRVLDAAIVYMHHSCVAAANAEQIEQPENQQTS